MKMILPFSSLPVMFCCDSSLCFPWHLLKAFTSMFLSRNFYLLHLHWFVVLKLIVCDMFFSFLISFCFGSCLFFNPVNFMYVLWKLVLLWLIWICWLCNVWISEKPWDDPMWLQHNIIQYNTIQYNTIQ